MLYITTRNNTETFASRHTLKEDFAPDGGHFVPVDLPVYDIDKLSLLRNNSFGTNLANILGVFFNSQLTGWDVDVTVGRNICKTVSISHRIIVAELWHTLEDELQYISKQLYAKIMNISSTTQQPSVWFRIASSIAILFALYGELLRTEQLHLNQKIDISVSGHDFLLPLSVVYAKRMGLPINTIVFSCMENSPVWDLIHRGSFNTSFADTALQNGVEHLLHALLGQSASVPFLEKCRSGQTYYVDEELIGSFSKDLFCAVPGTERAATVINSVYRTSEYLLTPDSALCYGGMQDYRASTGQSRVTLILAKENPMRFMHEIVRAAGISEEVLLKQIRNS